MQNCDNSQSCGLYGKNRIGASTKNFNSNNDRNLINTVARTMHVTRLQSV